MSSSPPRRRRSSQPDRTERQNTIPRRQEPATGSAAAPDRWVGWAVFGAIMLCIAGSVNVMQGMVALLDEGYFLVPDGDDLLLVGPAGPRS